LSHITARGLVKEFHRRYPEKPGPSPSRARIRSAAVVDLAENPLWKLVFSSAL
jgi:hypothetical protein